MCVPKHFFFRQPVCLPWVQYLATDSTLSNSSNRLLSSQFFFQELERRREANHFKTSACYSDYVADLTVNHSDNSSQVHSAESIS